jgi:hypothetical protein
VIAATVLTGIRCRPRGERTGPPAPAATSFAPPLKSSAKPRLPLRGRIWGAVIPPWPNYSSRRERDRL